MLEVKEFVPQHEWDALVQSLGGGFFHSSAWIACRCDGGYTVPQYCLWREAQDGAVRAAAAGFLRPPPDRLAGRVIARLHFNSPPARERVDERILPALVDWLKLSRSRIGATLGAFDARQPWSTHQLPNAVHVLEFLVRRPDEATGAARMREMTRRSIKKARRLGVEVATVEDMSDVAAFAALAKALHESLQSTKGVRVETIELAKATRRWHGLIRSGHGRLYVAYLDGRALSGCLFCCFGRRAYYLQNGAVGEARRTGATPLILNTAIEDFFAEGMVEVNLGRVAAGAVSANHPDHGLLEFKAGFGADLLECEGGEILTRRIRSKLVAQAARRLRRR